MYAFGNLHDSDNETSTYKFADKNYGERYGEHYPLYNWCVSFKDLSIE